MKETTKRVYAAPKIELQLISIEQGIAASGVANQASDNYNANNSYSAAGYEWE